MVAGLEVVAAQGDPALKRQQPLFEKPSAVEPKGVREPTVKERPVASALVRRL